MAINKVEAFGNTIIDLSGDTVTPESLDAGVTAHNAAGERIVGTRYKTVDYWKYTHVGPAWIRIGEMNSNGKSCVLFDISTSWTYNTPIHICFIFSQEWNSINSIGTKIKMLFYYNNVGVVDNFRFVRDAANDAISKTYFDVHYLPIRINTIHLTVTNLGVNDNRNGEYVHFYKPDSIAIDPEILDTQVVNEYPQSEWENLV